MSSLNLGKDAKITYNDITIGKVQDANYNPNIEEVDDTGIGEAYRSSEEAIRDPSIDFTVVSDADSAAHTTMHTLATSAGALMTDGLKYYRNASDYYAFPATARVSGFSSVNNVGGTEILKFTVKSCGEVTFTDA